MISEAGKTYLANNKNVKVAHLVELELAGEDSVFDYLTDYKRRIDFGGKSYQPGKVMTVGTVKLTQGLTNYKVSITVPGEYQEELDKVTTDESYEGRTLRIYKAYIDSDGSIVSVQDGGPVYFFEGYITDVSLNDNVTSGKAVVTWSCAGELQDFEKINGRLTDDASHRGLISTTEGDVPSNAAKREAYKTDTGFLHTNQTIATNISYLTTETEYYFKKKWHGLGGDLRERDVEVEKEIELKLSLTAKYLPVIYGVRKVQGIPVFVDADKNDPSRVFAVYAVSEGEIESFLNVYIDGVSAICGPGGNTEDTGTCFGNTADGDTLAVFAQASRRNERRELWRRHPYDRFGGGRVRSREIRSLMIGDDVPGVNVQDDTVSNNAGSTHGDTYNIPADGGPIKMTFYHGKPDQLPNRKLVNLAASNGFLIQNEITKPDGSPWGPEYWADYREGVQSGAALLDTAYVVCEFFISEDRTTLPEIEFVVDGKKGLVFENESTFYYERTLNPVWHLADYLTSTRFGTGLSFSKLNISSLIETANRLDVVDDSYSSSYVKYWRYLGWQSGSGPKSRMQCNTLLDTSRASTKEVETLLRQFTGSLVPIRGSYHLSVENEDPTVADITMDDLIGSVRIQNKPNKDKWNSINASIEDPAQNWSTNQVTFFNSNYLEQDNGIRKDGRTIFKHITNYFTARSWAEYILNTSRYAKTVRIKTYFKYLYLKPNDNVTFTYPRYGFVAENNRNKFRVVELSDNPDGTIDITLERYSDGDFLHSDQSPNEGGNSGTSSIPIPSGLTFIELPDASVNVESPEGGLYGILMWDQVDSGSLLRYEIRGATPSSTIFADPDVTLQYAGGEKVYQFIPIEPQTTYELKVCTVTNSGKRSGYGVIEVTTTNPPVANLPNIGGLRLVNSYGTDLYFGPDITMAWNYYNVDYVDNLEVQILKPDDTIIGTYLIDPTLTEFTLTLATNKALYQNQELTPGAYRRLKLRIRAVSGSTVSNWSNI
jgi:hypothetical protein